MKKVKIYTDGASGKNDGNCPGGWAAIIINEDNSTVELSGREDITTNNKMELGSAIQGLKHLTEPCEVELYSDSAYLINCFLQKWYIKWQSNGWKTSEGKPVANKELWRELIQLNQTHNITFKKVKGHADDEFNNRCDELAKNAIRK